MGRRHDVRRDAVRLAASRGAERHRDALAGISTREYAAAAAAAAEAVPEAFGLAKSTVSRRFIRASAHALQQFHARRHDDREWLGLLLDGKTFAEDQVVIALGVTPSGEKRVLGLVQTATENTRACAACLRELIERGFAAPKGLPWCSTGREASGPPCATCSATPSRCSAVSGTSGKTS